MTKGRLRRSHVVHLVVATTLIVGGVAFLVLDPFRLGPEAWIVLALGFLDLGLWVAQLILDRKPSSVLAYEQRAAERMQAAAERDRR